VLRRQLRRSEVIGFFSRPAPTLVALEACGASHYWARELRALGHDARLIAPQLAKPYVKRGKNDSADAQAVCEAASRPTMRFVAVKSAGQQAALMLAGQRERLVRQRVQRDHSTAGKARPGRITRAGDAMLRSLLVVGATATIWQTRRGAARQASSRQASPWLLALLQRKPAKLAAVALANKIARIAWKLMTSAERYAGAPQPAAIA
jgi:transposase